MGATTVTNAEFQAFVEATGYVTEAELIGWSFVFWAQVPKADGATQAVAAVEWCRRVDGANWRNINGPDTMAQAWHLDHPVVQVSWNDARGGLDDVPFPWGKREPNDKDHTPCNSGMKERPLRMCDYTSPRQKDRQLSTGPERMRHGRAAFRPYSDRPDNRHDPR